MTAPVSGAPAASGQANDHTARGMRRRCSGAAAVPPHWQRPKREHFSCAAAMPRLRARHCLHLAVAPASDTLPPPVGGTLMRCRRFEGIQRAFTPPTAAVVLLFEAAGLRRLAEAGLHFAYCCRSATTEAAGLRPPGCGGPVSLPWPAAAPFAVAAPSSPTSSLPPSPCSLAPHLRPASAPPWLAWRCLPLRAPTPAACPTCPPLRRPALTPRPGAWRP